MTTKLKSAWFCGECGAKQKKWSGQCFQCSSWNTLHEEVIVQEKEKKFQSQTQSSKPVRLNEITQSEISRILTDVKEFDRLMGGGIVPGSLTLIGGDPGIGKSTLMLQLSNVLAKKNLVVLYVCGEESVEQTSMRANRLGINSENLYLFSETNFNLIHHQIELLQPDVLIVDSIQIIYKSELTSAPGSVSQVRETTSEFMHISKGKNITTFIIGHVTKSGELAGPRVLEHLVDTVLYFEGDKQHNYRMIRVVKNRFGPTDEIGVFQMQKKGLAEVPNPSKIFLEERTKGSIGSVIIPTLEGSRTLLIEAQALVTETAMETPSRRSTGIDPTRLALLLAVLEKRAKFKLFRSDVFVSIAGGLRINEPGTDLGILIAVASSLKNCIIDSETVIIGEVGLGGEVRSVSRMESRIKETVQMGFKKCIIPKRNVKGISEELIKSVQVIGVEFVEEAIHALM